MCVCVCVCIYLFFMYVYSFEQICVKFGMWHPYTIWVVMGGLASTCRAHGLTLHVPTVLRCKPLASSVCKLGTTGQQVQQIKRHRHENWVLQTWWVTERHRRKGGLLVKYIMLKCWNYVEIRLFLSQHFAFLCTMFLTKYAKKLNVNFEYWQFIPHFYADVGCSRAEWINLHSCVS